MTAFGQRVLGGSGLSVSPQGVGPMSWGPDRCGATGSHTPPSAPYPRYKHFLERQSDNPIFARTQWSGDHNFRRGLPRAPLRQ
jgi:hypothetical protein